MFDEVGGAVVADFQVTLHRGNGGLVGFNHAGHGFVVQRIAAAFVVAAFVGIAEDVVAADAAGEQVFDVIGFAELFEVFHYAVYFFVGSECAVYALRIAGARRQEQHVALTEQVFRTHLVEDGAAVDFARHLEGDAGRNIGFNQAGNHVYARPLGGQNQVDARRARLLCDAGDQFFDFFARRHHQVGKFVHHHDDKRQFFQRFGIVGREAEGVADFAAVCGLFAYFLVVAREVAYAQMAHQAVAFFHFVHTPGQRVGGQAHVGYHRREQVRDAFVNAQFQHFRVDHNHAHVVGRGLEQHGQNHGVHAHGFARTGRTGHQEVRRAGKVGDDGLAGDVLPQRERELGGRFGERGRIENFAQAYHLAFRIGQFQAHAGFAGDGFHHADGGDAERAGKVFFQIQHGIAAHADVGFDFVAGDDRPGIRFQHFDFDLELGQFFFDGDAVFQQCFLTLRRIGIVAGGFQQVEAGQRVEAV